MNAEQPLFQARAHGKFLLSGEYFVLDGAKALAIPLQYGQDLTVTANNQTGFLEWQSIDVGGIVWMSATFELGSLSLMEVEGNETAADKLEEIFQSIRTFKPDFLTKEPQGVQVIIKADFPLDWGLGSSSTLMYLLAKWAQVDPFQLQFQCFGGSGYDIACAGANGPILYNKLPEPTFRAADFNPRFADKLYFVYLGQKQNSREAIARYRQLDISKKDPIIHELNDLTNQMLQTQDFEVFCALLHQHEDLMSKALQQERVQYKLFPDFDGVVKSLGAWGGDFVLVASPQGSTKTLDYFRKNGFPIVKHWDEMVLMNYPNYSDPEN